MLFLWYSICCTFTRRAIRTCRMKNYVRAGYNYIVEPSYRTRLRNYLVAGGFACMNDTIVSLAAFELSS